MVEGSTFHLFTGHADQNPVLHKLKCVRATVSLYVHIKIVLTGSCPLQKGHEFPLFQDIQKNVKSLYVNGQPWFHLASAKSREYNPNDLQLSSIFVVHYKDFSEMPGAKVQAIFRH